MSGHIFKVLAQEQAVKTAIISSLHKGVILAQRELSRANGQTGALPFDEAASKKVASHLKIHRRCVHVQCRCPGNRGNKLRVFVKERYRDSREAKREEAPVGNCPRPTGIHETLPQVLETRWLYVQICMVRWEVKGIIWLVVVVLYRDTCVVLEQAPAFRALLASSQPHDYSRMETFNSKLMAIWRVRSASRVQWHKIKHRKPHST